MATSSETELVPFTEHHVQTGETLASIAEKYGLTWQDLAQFNFGTSVPDKVNRCLHEYIGCTQRAKDGKTYLLSDEDVPGILYVPKALDPLTLAAGKRHRIQVKRPRLFSRVEVQTVDEFGHRVGDVDLILRSPDGLPDASLHAGKEGYGKLDKIRAGRYQILLASGDPTYMFDATQSGAGGDANDDANDGADRLVEAQIDTRNHTRAITRVVVAQAASEQERGQRRLLKRIYERKGPATSLDGRGEATRGKTHRSARYCVDNLALAAGWTSNRDDVDLKALVGSVLSGFLQDYHPTALARGFHVLVLTPTARTLVVMSSDGIPEGRFELAEGVTTRGLIGAYAVFENVSGTTFVDMASMSSVVGVPGKEDGIDIDKIVSDPQGLRNTLQKHDGEVEILYYAPTSGQLGGLGLLGGTGRLENYGHDDEVNASIHQRNLAVCGNIKLAYDGYVNAYVKRVEATGNEDELRRLGPPQSPYEMPTPAGATDQQMTEIFQALNTSEFEAWVTVAHQLDRFANRLSQGYPFLRIKPKYVAKPKTINKIKNFLRPGLPDISEKFPGEVEFEMNIDIQLVDGQFQVVTKGDVVLKGKVKLDGVVNQVTGSGVPVEVAFKQSKGNPDKQTLSVKLGKFQIDMDTLGKTKLSVETGVGTLDGEMNPTTGMFGVGVTLKGKDLATKMRGQSPSLNKWADRIENTEVQVQVGLVGTREETILAVVSNGPGFFQRRSLAELFAPGTQWVDLTLDEHQRLVDLGWYAAVWDGKYHAEYKEKLPESVGKTRDELSDVEKVAIVCLGFYAYEDYHKLLKQSVNAFSDYEY
jgi:hypothetical protein